MNEICEDIFNDLYLPNKDTHKGQNGKVLIIGGSKYYFGAPILAGLSALKIVDKVGIFSVRHVTEKITHPEFIIYENEGDFLSSAHIDYALKISKHYDVVLIGSGMGEKKESISFLNAFISSYGGKKILDADAIKMLHHSRVLPQRSILTPNKKEYTMIKSIERELLSNDNIIVVKGFCDIIITREKKWYYEGGNAGLTKAGTGDVFAGIMAAFYSKNNAFVSASSSILLMDRVSERLYGERGFFYTPLDIITEIPYVLKELLME